MILLANAPGLLTKWMHDVLRPHWGRNTVVKLISTAQPCISLDLIRLAMWHVRGSSSNQIFWQFINKSIKGSSFSIHHQQALYHLICVNLFIGLDVVNASTWPALPDTYFGRNLLDEAEVVAVGYTGGSTHAVLNTANKDVFLRGRSHLFHLCMYWTRLTQHFIIYTPLDVTLIRFIMGQCMPEQRVCRKLLSCMPIFLSYISWSCRCIVLWMAKY